MPFCWFEILNFKFCFQTLHPKIFFRFLAQFIFSLYLCKIKQKPLLGPYFEANGNERPHSTHHGGPAHVAAGVR